MKRRFIQAFVIRHCREAGHADGIITVGEQIWEILTRRGYGAPDPTGPREGKDWYGLLSERQRLAFDAFWRAFGLKKGRNNAAMRWHQLGELTEAEYGRLIAAASAEAARELPQGQARKWAEGWLQERRWEDHAIAGVAKTAVERVESAQLGRLRESLRSFQHMQGLRPTSERERQIADIKARIAELEATA
jgi:hypothetical protein